MSRRADHPERLATVLQSMNRDLAVELWRPRAHTGEAACAYADFSAEISRVLAAAGIEAAPPRRISEFSTAELLDELRRRHSRG